MMLRNNETEISKTLLAMESPRRIALTGTPFQNSLIEYFRMTDWIRPGCLANSEPEFKKRYENRINSSLTVSFISLLTCVWLEIEFQISTFAITFPVGFFKRRTKRG